MVGTLVGDVRRDPDARTKYGLLFESLAERLPLVDVYDVRLRGIERLGPALRTFRLDRHRWHQRYTKDAGTFRRRSRRAKAYLRSLGGRADVVLQVGVLFDARWDGQPLPSVIYTDYSMRLWARSAFWDRSPLPRRQLRRWLDLEAEAYRRAAHVLTRSEHVRASLIADYDLPAEHVTAIGGGVNFRQLPDLEPRPADRPPTALFIGHELHRKGGDVLLRAFAETRARVPGARLLLLTGDTVPEDLPLDGVELVRSAWDRDRITELFRQADLFVLPSRLETWGDVLLEAMAHGLPCIGVRGESMEEIITHGETGLLVPVEDPQALTAALSELLLDLSRCRQWGLAARQRVEAGFTWDRVVERMTPFLEETAGVGG